MNWKVNIRSFSELQTSELYEILKLRSAVFVNEQVCPYQDMDDADQTAIHMWVMNPKFEMGAYLRIISSHDDHVSIGRVVSDQKWRGQGLGKQIFREGISYCHQYFPRLSIKISAQLYLKKFYSKFGFEQTGTIYLEDGIPHIEMIYSH